MSEYEIWEDFSHDEERAPLKRGPKKGKKRNPIVRCYEFENLVVEAIKNNQPTEGIKKEFVWICYGELKDKVEGVAKTVAYNKRLNTEEIEVLIQETCIYFHHLHMTFNPFFLPGKQVPYVFYILNMIRQKLRYHVQSYHVKKNREDLKDEIPDHEMPLTEVQEEQTELPEIIKKAYNYLDKEHHKRIFSMLMDGYKQKQISVELQLDQSSVSNLIKQRIRPAVLKAFQESNQVELLSNYKVNWKFYEKFDFGIFS